jgi:quercetin dioxygenase-like cupin family protein
MKREILILAASCSIVLSACNQHNDKQAINTTPVADSVFSKGKKITNDNFKGTAYLQMLVMADSANKTTVGNVTFEPGARTKWHLHPAGQILLVTNGVGYYQEKGQAKKILRKGDVIKCPPNIVHWHGASADTSFIQLAITGGEKGETVWMDEVTDDVYTKN